MEARWVLSTFYRDEFNNRIPVASAYGREWFCPAYPAAEDGAALVRISVDPHQVEAAKRDPRITVCPRVGDPRAVPDAVATAHARHGAQKNMSMAEMLATMGDVEPLFGEALSHAHGH